MSTKNTWRLGALAALVAGAVAFGAAAPALADPSGTPAGGPTTRPLAGVGSDTTQDVNNGLSEVVKIGGAKVLASYDATGTATINPRTGGATFSRPDGSGAGVNALKAAKAGTAYNGVVLGNNDLQFARSSSAATWVTGGTYAYVPLALDAVSFAKAPTTSVPANLTKADLTAIYSANDNTNVTLSVGTFKVGKQTTAGAQIVPFLPQANSGTRKFWLSELGITTVGSAVADNYTKAGASVSVQEHDGSVLADVPNAISPFSIAQWIGQNNSGSLASQYGVTVVDRRHGAVLGSVNGTAPTVSNVLNTAFPISRPVFTVVKAADLTAGSPLATVFQGPTGLAYTAKNPTTGKKTITDFGFGDITGGAVVNGVTYTAGDVTSFRAN